MAFFSGALKIASNVSFEPVTIAASGDQVLAVVHIRGNRTGSSGSSTIDTHDVHVFTVTNEGSLSASCTPTCRWRRS